MTTITIFNNLEKRKANFKLDFCSIKIKELYCLKKNDYCLNP